MKRENRKLEFSKTLLIQESALIWIVTLAYIILAFYCISHEYLGTLPWLTGSASLPWVAYGVSQGFYYNKSKKENTAGGIKYELALKGVAESDNSDNNNAETSESATTAYDMPIDINGPI